MWPVLLQGHVSASEVRPTFFRSIVSPTVVMCHFDLNDNSGKPLLALDVNANFPTTTFFNNSQTWDLWNSAG